MIWPNSFARCSLNGKCSCAGTALVELAIALPVLVVLVIGTADFARVFYYTIELENAARAGAQYGAVDEIQAQSTADIKAAAQNAVQLNLGTIVVGVGQNAGCPPADQTSPTCQCFNDDGTAGAPGGVVACTSICTTGHLVETITVTASKTFNSISRLPGLPRSLNLCRSATFRVVL